MKQPIRLTNKTAIALRKNAQKIRTAHYTAATLLSMGMAGAAVYFGIQWLPAVPIAVLLCVIMDCAILMRARSQYLLLLGQAICTEAAARDIRMGGREQSRKERAINDLLEAKADIKKAESQQKGQLAHAFSEKGLSKEFDRGITEGKKVAISAMHDDEDAEMADAPRRRRQQKSLQLIKNNQAK